MGDTELTQTRCEIEIITMCWWNTLPLNQGKQWRVGDWKGIQGQAAPSCPSTQGLLLLFNTASTELPAWPDNRSEFVGVEFDSKHLTDEKAWPEIDKTGSCEKRLWGKFGTWEIICIVGPFILSCIHPCIICYPPLVMEAGIHAGLVVSTLQTTTHAIH